MALTKVHMNDGSLRNVTSLPYPEIEHYEPACIRPPDRATSRPNGHLLIRSGVFLSDCPWT
jgi:hypothetical protein